MSENQHTEDSLQYELYGNNGLTVITRAGEVHTLTDEHPNFSRLRSLLFNSNGEVSDEEVLNLVNFGFAFGEQMEALSERLKFDGSTLFFDGDPLNSLLADHIIEMVKQKDPQLQALVNFLENLSMNPSESAKNDLYHWITVLKDHGEKLTITRGGMLVAYKGVRVDANGVSVSINSGPGIIDGVTMKGHLPNKVGSTVEISRSYVDSNSAVGCSTGLHAGTWSYAHGFAQGRTLKVEINPRDVVSVPEDCGFQKIRTCRYVVLEETEAPDTLPVYRGIVSWDDEAWDEWSEAGYSDERGEEYEIHGYSVEDAIELEKDGGIDFSEEDYDEEDYDDTEDWLEAGFSYDEIEDYRDIQDLTIAEAVEARDEEDEEDSEEDSEDDENLLAFVPAEDTEDPYAEWEANGFDREESDRWKAIGYTPRQVIDELSEDADIQKASKGKKNKKKRKKNKK